MRGFLLFLFLLILAAVAAYFWEDSNFAAPGPLTQDTTIIVKPGSGLGQIATQLEEAGVVENALLFRAGVMRRGDTSALKAGEYAIPAHASMADILNMLIKHKAVEHKVTVAEGLTSAMAAAAVNADPVLQGADVVPPEEGTVLPETYLFERGTTRAEMITRMQKAQSDLVTELWQKRQPGLPYKSPREAVIMASIVEKETALPQERGHIARVFLNRLQQGMKLESDPTIIYGLTKGVPLGHPLRVSELARPNPYSTYQIAGLPPGPICNPGRDSLAAVLDPPQSADLFFVANGTGGHAFSATLAEHQRNVAAWRALQNPHVTPPASLPATPPVQPSAQHGTPPARHATHRKH